MSDRSGIEIRILVARGQRVMLDTQLARLYGVEVRALNQAVKRNITRFPGDFMFQLEREEVAALRSQIVILEEAPRGPRGRGRYAKYLPRAFTKQRSSNALLSSTQFAS